MSYELVVGNQPTNGLTSPNIVLINSPQALRTLTKTSLFFVGRLKPSFSDLLIAIKVFAIFYVKLRPLRKGSDDSWTIFSDLVIVNHSDTLYFQQSLLFINSIFTGNIYYYCH